MEISMSKTSYCKLLLHLSKYPHLACNGLLLSKTDRESASSLVEIVDCIPLFHSSLTLAPSFEIALTQIDHYCQKNGLSIFGYYQSNENINDNQPNLLTYKIAEKLKENYPNSLVFMINNKKVNPEAEEPCYKIYNYADQKLKEYSCKSTIEDLTFDSCTYLLNEKKHHLLVDFDNHLDNISLDWRNTELNKLINSSKIESLSTKIR